ncbi:hypothetical protein, partial [Stenotrophomonas sp. 3(2025)]|uniref:hypothetical protein n=1 Tax=Stenotrophomonas sp. 3(2025) TaxID=3456023 RepID=UPI004043F17F
MLPVADSWLTSPLNAVALPSALSAVVLAALAVVCAALAVFWAEVTLLLVAVSCRPVTASVLLLLSVASATP